MSNGLPQFLPTKCPASPILDLSSTLSPQAVSSLNQVAGAVTYKPVIVVLPRDYDCPDARELTINLAKAWKIDGVGKNLLIVVDLKGHNVRAHGSPAINQAGVTSEYISNSLIPEQFIPYMRQSDLTTAIRLTLLDANRVQSQSQIQGQVTSQISQPSAPPVIPKHIYISLTSLLQLLFFLLCTVVAVKLVRTRQSYLANQKKLKDMKVTLDSLYQKADQLGQASEFLEPSTNTALSNEIADFFAKLTTILKAQEQVEELAKKSSAGKSTQQAIYQLERYLNTVEPMGYSLLRRVDSITGGTISYESNPKIATSNSPGQDSVVTVPDKIARSPQRNPSVDMAYRRPSWFSEPAYQRSASNDGLADIHSFFALQNYSSSSSGSSSSDFTENSHQPQSSSHSHHTSSSGGGFWGSSQSDHSRGRSSDGGSSWSSSSDNSSSSDSSSSSSDGGGSW